MIDTATEKVVATITAGVGTAVAVAITSDGQRVYVANKSSNDVSVIETTKNKTVGKRIKVGRQPRGVAIIDRDP